MDSLPTYFISFYNACKWFLIAQEWDLSISITADRFEPSIGVLLLLLVYTVPGGKSSSSSNNSLELLNLLYFLKCVLTLLIFLLIRAVQCLHMTFNLSLSISSKSAYFAAPFLSLPKGILNTKLYCFVSKNR